MPGDADQPATVPGIRVDADGVSQRVRGQQTLREISLAIAPGELVAIVGSSGAGKTMLLETLAGLRRPETGMVRYDGADCQASLSDLRSSLGYVPQDDIIHFELSLERTLWYAARLRLPTSARTAQVGDAVRHVLSVLDLNDRAGAAVGSLSGGERKRASIGVELLTAPRLFLLDEPTSGLDPATAADFMRLLRRLADTGTTVVLTTHNMPDTDVCDKIAFLAREGTLAFAGPPDRAREHFGTARLEEAYQQLDHEPRGEWRAPASLDAPAASLDAPAAAPPAQREAAGRRPGPVRQWALLMTRNVDLLRHNRLTLAILLGSPAMVLLMFVVLFRPNGFSFAHPSPNGTLMTVFWIAFAGFFFGLSYGLPQICAELPIVRREHHVGVGLGPYVLSKVAVLMPLLAVVDAATLGVLRVLGRLPATGPAETGSLFVTLVLASAAALGIGLLTSAAVNGPSQAIVAMPMLCFPQVLFSGAFISVPAMALAGKVISYAMSDRWTFEALGHAVGLPHLWAGGGSPLGPPLLASYGATFSHAAWIDWIILGSFTVILLAATRAVLGARCGTRLARRGSS